MSTATDNRKTPTVEEAARFLGIGRGTAYEAIRTGAIPSLRLERRVVVPRVALERLLAGDGLHHATDPNPVPVTQNPVA